MAGSEAALAWEEDKLLQETIRFVFSHEQEGLLAIGTFALDQLAGVHLGLDGRLKPPAATDDQSPSNYPRRNSNVSRVQLVLRSSDDEMDERSPINSIPVCKKKELPVFGDHDALSDLYPTTLSVETTKTTSLPSIFLNHNSGTDSSQVDTKTGNRDEMLQVNYESDGEFYSPGACGLFFASRSRRTQKLGEKEKRKKLQAEERVGNTDVVKKTDRSKGFSSTGRLWRSGCYGPPATAEVTPEPQMITERESSQVQVNW